MDAEFNAWWKLMRGDESTAPLKEVARAAAEWADKLATERAAKIVEDADAAWEMNHETAARIRGGQP